MPMSMKEATDELRYRAARLRQEMDLPRDPSSSDGKACPAWLVLALAMLEAANDEWEKLFESNPLVRDRAKDLARKEHSDVDIIVGARLGQPPVVASVPKMSRKDGDARLAEVLAIPHNLAAIRPIWVHYIPEARESLGL